MFRTQLKYVKVTLLSVAFCLPVFAEVAVPKLVSPIIDEANMFSFTEKRKLENILNAVDQSTQMQIAVLTLPSLQGDPIENVSIRVVDAWKLGQEKSDQGLLLLISKQDRKVRLEVGQGLEGYITDAYSNRIINQIIIPNFKSGNVFDGTVQAIYQSLRYVLPKEKVDPFFETSQVYQFQGGGNNSIPWPIIIFWIIFILIHIYQTRQRMKNGTYDKNGYRSNSRGGFGQGPYFGGGFGSGGSSGSGGFGGFSGGGGGFSGGGSSGSW